MKRAYDEHSRRDFIFNPFDVADIIPVEKAPDGGEGLVGNTYR